MTQPVLKVLEEARPLATPGEAFGPVLRRAAVLIALATVLMRLGFFIMVQPWRPDVEQRAILVGDPVNYHRLASTLVDYGRFAESEHGPATAFRTPLYPLVLAGVYALAGPKPWAGLLAQIAIEAASCLLLMWAVRRIFSPQVALWAGAIYAVDPFLIFYSSMLLSDTLFVFFMVAMLASLTAAFPRPAARSAVLGCVVAGCCLGAATLVRPASQYLPLLLIPFLLVRHRAYPKRGLAMVAGLVVACAVVLAPWVIRNQRVLGHPLLSTAGTYQLLILDASPVYAARTGMASLEAEGVLVERARAAMRADGHDPDRLTEWERGGYWRRVAVDEIKAHPWLFARIYARGTMNTLINLNTSGICLHLGKPVTSMDMNRYHDPVSLFRGFFASKGGFAIGLALFLGLYLLVWYLNTALGILLRMMIPDFGPMWLMLAIAAYFILIGGPGSGVRYKLPALPFLLPFTAFTLARAMQRFTAKFS